jgi:nicotinamide riboside kinase
VPNPVAAPQLVCLIGAECTGKTTLARALAQHWGAPWVAEYLRTFCQQQGRTPEVHEQALIMRRQFEQEEQALAQAALVGSAYVFCDTTALLTALYSDYYFGDSSLHDAARTLQARYALSLVLIPDLPWQGDGLQRDSEPVRQAVHTLLVHELQTMRYPHITVSGVGEQRLQAAILAVQTLRS